MVKETVIKVIVMMRMCKKVAYFHGYTDIYELLESMIN